MKDVVGMLRRIDEEITGHNQRIALSRLEIMRLQETRLTLMGLAEQDEAAKAFAAGQPSLLAGSSAKPVLIVRKTSEDAPTPAADRKKARDAEAYQRRKAKAKAAKEEGKRTGRGGHPRRTDEWAAPALRERVTKLLSDDVEEGMTATEIGNFFDMPTGDKARKPLQNCLWHMTNTRGLLKKDAEGRYTLAANPQPQPNGGAAH